MGKRMENAIKRYEQIQAKNLLGGGVKHIERQHGRGKLTTTQQIFGLNLLISLNGVLHSFSHMNIPYYVLLITFYEIYKSQITSIKFQINLKFQ